jgi:hypothetical protein
MHAVEGSDRAVVPMKLPNKEGLRLGGGGGGKSADQAERCGTLHEPDTERGSPCPRVPRRARSEFRFDAIIQGKTVCGNAARTDLCGGRLAIAVPTATDLRRVFFASLRTGERRKRTYRSETGVYLAHERN